MTLTAIERRDLLLKDRGLTFEKLISDVGSFSIPIEQRLLLIEAMNLTFRFFKQAAIDHFSSQIEAEFNSSQKGESCV